jgi:hypothetical protein
MYNDTRNVNPYLEYIYIYIFEYKYICIFIFDVYVCYSLVRRVVWLTCDFSRSFLLREKNLLLTNKRFNFVTRDSHSGQVKVEVAC